MALNPYFLQGSRQEQRLVQNLVNEHLKIYGQEVTYIPRKFVNQSSIIEEVQASKFDDNFAIEAYVDTYEGYQGAGDVLTKFGMSLRDEVTLTISKERFEEFISPFMEADDDVELSSRPREGDLVFFPLGQRLFEIKFVEHEEPFYQLGNTYVYKLKCELFEYEDEVIDTSIEAIDTQVADEGYIATLRLVGVGRTATAVASIDTGYIREIFLNNDGSGFTGTPTVAISTSPSGLIGDNAAAVAITTTRANITSVEKILLTNAGANYTSPPIITISGGGGTGANGRIQIHTANGGVNGDGIAIKSTGDHHMINFVNSSGSTRGQIRMGGSVSQMTIAYENNSDRRLKKDIVDMVDMIDKILELKPRNFRWRENNIYDYGFIAQEVHNVFPHLRPDISYYQKNKNCCKDLDCPTQDCYCYDSSGNHILDSSGNCMLKEETKPYYYGIDYGKMTPYLTKALQEVIIIQREAENKITAIENKYNVLKAKNDLLETKNEALEDKVNLLELKLNDMLLRISSLEASR